MTTFDFAPLYRSTVGFDHLASLLDSITSSDRSQPAFPPYNIELLEQDKYRITMAVAGFSEEDIRIESENNMLTVAAAKAEKADDSRPTYLHQGIAERNFRRQFRLADHVKVVGASLNNGLLHIELTREIPEAMKPRTIPINGTQPQRREVLQQESRDQGQAQDQRQVQGQAEDQGQRQEQQPEQESTMRRSA